MLKRLSIVALFTGSSHLTSLIALSVLATNVSEETIGNIGLVDSTIFLVMGILAFGLQLETVRELTKGGEWKTPYAKGQSARFSMSLLLCVLGLLLFLFSKKNEFLIFLASPLIALNGDFSLYGLGRAEKASLLSFIRVFLPSVAILICSFFFPASVLGVYTATTFASILLIGILASALLKVAYFHKPDFNFLVLYWKTKDMGVFSLSFIILTSGLIFFAKHFGYPADTLGFVYPVYKIYFILKGLQRIVTQSFINEIYQDAMALKLDKLCILFAVCLGIPTLVFPEFSITLLYGEGFSSNTINMSLLGCIALIATLRTTSETKLFLQHGDKQNARFYTLSMAITIGVIALLAHYSAPVLGILSALLIGEVLLLFFYVRELGGLSYLGPRWLFLLKSSTLLLPSVLLKISGLEENLLNITIGVMVTLLLILLFFKKVALIH